MCNRYVQKSDREDYIREFRINVEIPPDFVRPNYNTAPRQQVLVVRQIEEERRLDYLEWGLVPFWSKERKPKFATFNARDDRLATAASYREPFKRSRCLIPNNGFIEWKQAPDGKDPYLIYLKHRELAAFAGLWEKWVDKKTGGSVESCTIITTEANDLVGEIHAKNRMPVYIDPLEYDEWLDPANGDTDQLSRFFKPYPASEMAAVRLTREINSVKNNRAELLSPVEA